jgi:phosphoribosylformimino-5-aminoimidazole carboxamide ribotide isomerase
MYSQTKMRTTPSRLLVPVLDLLAGEVVRARAGRRSEYRPLRSPLCTSSHPQAVAEALLGLYPFPVLYIADLDAIQGEGDNTEIIAALAACFPSVELWVDAGLPAEGAAPPRRTVLGSESLPDVTTATRLLEGLPSAILSLDFRHGFLGPPPLLETPALWPEDVIVMALERVGMERGPDLARLAELRARAPDRRLHAAGGVRDGADLARLAELGFAGALVASALHEGRIGSRDIHDFVSC